MLFELWTAWDFLRDYWPWVLGVVTVLAAMGAYAWFMGSIRVAAEAALGVVIALGGVAIYRRGAASEKARNDALADRTVARTRETQAEVDRMGDAEVDRRLDRWIPPETKP